MIGQLPKSVDSCKKSHDMFTFHIYLYLGFNCLYSLNFYYL